VKYPAAAAGSPVPLPGVLLRDRQQLPWLAQDAPNAIVLDGLAVGDVMQEESNRPFARPVSAFQIFFAEIEVLQRLVASGREIVNELH